MDFADETREKLDRGAPSKMNSNERGRSSLLRGAEEVY